MRYSKFKCLVSVNFQKALNPTLPTMQLNFITCTCLLHASVFHYDYYFHHAFGLYFMRLNLVLFIFSLRAQAKITLMTSLRLFV